MLKRITASAIILLIVVALSNNGESSSNVGPVTESAKVNDIVVRYVTPDKPKLPEGEKLVSRGYPVIILIGHPINQNNITKQDRRLKAIFYGVDEPTIVVRSGALDNKVSKWEVSNWQRWRKKRKEFLKVMDFIRTNLPGDEDRIYLTGYSFDGVYAWMLAYDKPELYAGVVAVSAVSYPKQIQRKLKSGKDIVTVVIRGEKDHMFPRRLRQERTTGKKLESYNKYSKWILVEGYGHGGLDAHWISFLNYILQFRRHNEIVQKYKTSFRQASEILHSKVILEDTQVQELMIKAWDLYKKQKKYNEAIATYRKVAEDYPDHPKAQEALMMIIINYDWLARGATSDTERKFYYSQAAGVGDTVVETYVDWANSNPAFCTYAGHAFYKAGQLEKALERFQLILQMGADVKSWQRASALLGSARCYEQLGQNEKALNNYQRFLEEFPDDKRAPEAREAIEQLSARTPSLP
jgi:tetratricopeptide (TPR) repeat protein